MTELQQAKKRIADLVRLEAQTINTAKLVGDYEKLQAELQQTREALKTILEIPLSEEDYFDDISIGYHAGVSSCKKIARAALPTPPEQEERPPYCQRCGAPVVWCMCKSTPPEQEANG